MKLSTYFWCGVAGVSGILLLGQLFADYQDLRAGVTRLFGLIALGVFAASGLNVIVAGTNGLPLKPVAIASLSLSGVVLLILLLIAAIGGGR